MSSKVEVPIEDAAVEWGKNLPLEDEKNQTTEGGGIGANLEGKEQVVKTQVPIDEGTYLPSNIVQTHLLPVPEEEDASKKPQLKMKKEKERKRTKLVKIKKVQQLGVVDKTEFPVEPHMPSDAEQAHSLCVPEEEDASRNLQMKKKEKERKRTKIVKIKKEQQLGGVDKTEFPVEPHMPGDAEQAHSLFVPEDEDASRNLQMKKKGKKRKRIELVKIKKEQQLGGVDKTQFPLEEPWRWHATFCTVLIGNSMHKGFLILRGNVKRHS